MKIILILWIIVLSWELLSNKEVWDLYGPLVLSLTVIKFIVLYGIVILIESIKYIIVFKLYLILIGIIGIWIIIYWK